MFEINGGGRIRRRARRPENWDALENWHDHKFIPETRRWDADEREWVARAIGLYDILPNAMYSFEDHQLKRLAREYCATGRLDLAAHRDA